MKGYFPHFRLWRASQNLFGAKLIFGGVLSVKAGLGKKETTRPVDFITVCPDDARVDRVEKGEILAKRALPNVSNTVS